MQQLSNDILFLFVVIVDFRFRLLNRECWYGQANTRYKLGTKTRDLYVV